MAWTRDPTFAKPDISDRATTLYYQIVAPLMLPFLDKRLLNLLRCREDRCFFQRNREHPPSGLDFREPVRFQSGLGIGPLPIIVGDRHADLHRCFPPPRQFDGEVLLVSRADLSDLPPVRAFKEFIAPRMAALQHSLVDRD